MRLLGRLDKLVGEASRGRSGGSKIAREAAGREGCRKPWQRTALLAAPFTAWDHWREQRQSNPARNAPHTKHEQHRPSHSPRQIAMDNSTLPDVPALDNISPRASINAPRPCLARQSAFGLDHPRPCGRATLHLTSAHEAPTAHVPTLSLTTTRLAQSPFSKPMSTLDRDTRARLQPPC